MENKEKEIKIDLGQTTRMIVLLFAAAFFSFIALSYLIGFGYGRQAKIYDLFMVIFSPIGLAFLLYGIRFISSVIKNVLGKYNYEQEKFKNNLTYSLVPFSVGGIFSIVLLFVYKHFNSLALKADRIEDYAYYVTKIGLVHKNFILIITSLSAIITLATIIILLAKNRFRLKDSALFSLYTFSLLTGVVLLTIVIIFVLSFFVFTLINLSGGAGFGP